MLPQKFVNMLQELKLGDAAEALTGTPEVSVRLNRAKPRPAIASTEGAKPVPWCERGLYLPSRPSFTLDPQWHQGLYYVQEAGSMFHAYIAGHLLAGVASPLKVLDACAAPGGKTTAVIDTLPEGSVIVANEYVPSRAAVLKENLIRWGYPGVIVTRADTAALGLLDETFDLIIADVPCSGEGMMRKDDDAVAQWSESLIEECASLQRRIVENLWPALRPGGTLIYSTCTFNRRENEENVAYICSNLGGETIDIPVDQSWGITPALLADGSPDPSLHCYRFIPGRTRSEGLFVAAIRKPDDASSHSSHVSYQSSPAHPSDKKSKPARSQRSGDRGGSRGKVSPESLIKECPRPAGDYEIIARDDRLTAFPRPHRRLLERVKEVADVIAEGILLATVKGSTLIPAHQLALSSALSPEMYPRHEIDLPTALDYLRGNSPVLPEEAPRGYVVLTYLGEPLGFVKNLGRRTNSLYPWKIYK